MTESDSNTIKADFHIHTCHSACGSLYMSPKNVINCLLKNNIKIAAISDHNSIKNIDSYINLGNKNGICIFPAMEIQTEEEIHCVVIFPDFSIAKLWQNWIDQVLPKVPLNPEIFGDQPIIDEDENIIELAENLLSISLPISFTQLEKKAFNDNLIFFPAHINDSSYSLISQLGFIPDDHLFKISEISKKTDLNEFSTIYSNIIFITNSDAHYPEQIGLRYNIIKNEKLIEIFNNYSKSLFSLVNFKDQIKLKIYVILKDEVFAINFISNNNFIKPVFNK